MPQSGYKQTFCNNKSILKFNIKCIKLLVNNNYFQIGIGKESQTEGNI